MHIRMFTRLMLNKSVLQIWSTMFSLSESYCFEFYSVVTELQLYASVAKQCSLYHCLITGCVMLHFKI